MALNVEQITSRLAQMPDAALQKYAAMNKSDPYIMALAVSESNRRKQMRQAAQGAQGQIPQPKVVDSAVQGMAAPMPEEMGIARLPAGDMNFADGGIVAFADGGDVEHYADMGFTGFSFGDWAAADKERRRKKLEEERAANMAAVARGTTYSPEAYGVETPAPLFQDPRLLGSAPAAPAAPTSMAPAGNQPAAPPAPTAKTDTAPRTPGAPATGGLEDIFKRLQKPVETDIAALRDQRKSFAQSLQDFAKKEESDFEAAEAKRGDVFKGREERLSKREGELAGMKDKNLGLALLQAGAAIMSTPGSLGMALGKGVDVGTKQYASGIDKLNAAQERLMDARDRLEELRTNREDMTAKERRALKSNINRSVLEGEKLFLDGAEKDLGYRREDMKTLFSGLVTDMASQRSAAATAAAASRPPAEIQLIERIAAEKKIPFSQAYQEVVSTKREPQTQEALMKAWTNNAAIQLQYPNPQDYIRMMQGFGTGAGQLNPSDRALIDKYSR